MAWFVDAAMDWVLEDDGRWVRAGGRRGYRDEVRGERREGLEALSTVV